MFRFCTTLGVHNRRPNTEGRKLGTEHRTLSTELGAAELARSIASGERSARDVLETFIARIERANPRINALVVPLFDSARRAAAEADGRRERGEPLGPLGGVPVSIKECFDIAGTPTTAGIPQYATHRADADALLVRRLKDAGAIVLGKTNVPELLIYLEADNPVYGRTNNPWDLERTSGGSSGGEGALIAAGGSALGLGTDLGGSIRVPAHFSGIHGLKPTPGRLPLDGTFDGRMLTGQEAIRDAAGPLARRVDDLALAMEVLSGPAGPGDADVPPVPLGRAADVAVESLRIGWYADDGFFPPAPALRRAVTEAADALRDRGAMVAPFRPPDVAEAMRIYLGLLSADGGGWARPVLGPGRHDRRVRDLVRLAGLPRPARAMLVSALGLAGQRRLGAAVGALGRRSVGRYWDLVADRVAYEERFLAVLDAGRFDALICPPNATPAFTHGASYYLTMVASYGMLYNLLGLPAGVVAATRVRPEEETEREPGRDLIERTARRVEVGSAGLPVGVQVVARRWREDIVLAVMGALEESFRSRPDYPAEPNLE